MGNRGTMMYAHDACLVLTFLGTYYNMTSKDDFGGIDEDDASHKR